MELDSIIECSKEFRVMSKNGKFGAVIAKNLDEFVIQSGGRVNYDFEHSLYAGDEYLDRMADYC